MIATPPPPFAADLAAVHGEGTAVANQNAAAQFVVAVCIVTNDCAVFHRYVDAVIRQNTGTKLSRLIVL